jgi:4-hydroxy-tetrahydrodipicolinate reductase
MSTKILISGATGRMGQALVRLIAEHRELDLLGGIDRERKAGADAEAFGFRTIETAESCAELLKQTAVVIDFSAAEGLQNLLAARGAEFRGRALIVGTTGLLPEALGRLDEIAQHSPVLLAANFSIGVNLLLGLVGAAARVLKAESFDVEIVEAHHKRKVDAPSGTALALGQSVAQGRGIPLDSVRRDSRSGNTGLRPSGEIGFHALRGGDVVGEHTVNFIGGRERIEITHKAQDRALFAEGALMAAQWIVGKPPGMYTMSQVLGLDYLTSGK